MTVEQSKLVGKTIKAAEYRGDGTGDDVVARSMTLRFTDGTQVLVSADYHDGPSLLVELDGSAYAS